MIIDRRTSSVLFTGLIWALSAVVVYRARYAILMLIFAVLFAYLLEPLVVWLEQRLKVSRSVGIAITYGCLVLAGLVLFATIGPGTISGARKLDKDLPALMENLGSGEIARKLGDEWGWSAETKQQLQHFLQNHREAIRARIESLTMRAVGMLAAIPWLGLIPVFAVFILKGKSKFAAAMFAFTEGYENRRFLRSFINGLDGMLASFIRAQLTLAGLSLVVYALLLKSIGFPYSFLIAGIGGALEFIPVLGAIASAVLILGVAILTNYPHLFGVLVFLVLWRIFQDYINFPFIMGRGLELPAFAVVLGVFVSGEAAGIPGIYLSVPAMAALRLLWKNWKQRQDRMECKDIVCETVEMPAESVPSGVYCEFGPSRKNVAEGATENAELF